MIIKKKNFYYVSAIFVLMLIGLFASSLGVSWVALSLATLSFALFVVFIYKDLENNIFIFCFLICLFTFLLGGQILNRIFKVYYYDFPADIELHADICLLISIAALAMGYLLFVNKPRFEKVETKPDTEQDNLYIRSIRKISKWLYYGCYAFWILSVLDVILYVRRYGYISYYSSFRSSIPSVLRQIGYFAPTALFIFLATLPEKKESKWPIIAYLLYAVLSLGTGRRVNFIISLLFVFAYMMCRNSARPGDKPWVTRKMLVAVYASIPLLLIAMYLFEYIRAENYVGQKSDYSALFGFFVRQGTSINVIKFTEVYRQHLDPDAHYSFYNVLRWVSKSPLKFLVENKYVFGNQSVETATSGSYLADFVSYYAMRAAYLNGQGYGSCYIEELFVDFGYIGVFIGNFIYGVVFRKLANFITGTANIWKTATGLYMLNYLFQAPRSTFDAFFGHMLYPEYWFPILFVLIVSRMASNR